MFFDMLVSDSQLFFLIFARVIALLMVAPLISSATIPAIARVALALFVVVGILPWCRELNYVIPDNGWYYAALLVGEVLIGITLGFILGIVYAAFITAGQFFSLQMGFGASQVFDPLAQEQIPLMGQFFNIIGMYVFISVDGFQKLFLGGIYHSIRNVSAYQLILLKENLFAYMANALTMLFQNAFMIAIPVLGTLILISMTMGILAKAAPQLNLLMIGFPISISVAYLMIIISIPFIIEAFAGLIDQSFEHILRLLDGQYVFGSGGVHAA